MSRADIGEQDRSYRRGMVLGLTMAEIMILIVFALLLVLASILVARENQIHALEIKLKQVTADLAELTPQTGADQKPIEDIFRELALARTQAASLKAAEAKIAELQDKNRDADHLRESLKAAGNPNDPDFSKELVDRLDIATAVENAVGPAAAHDRQAIANLLRHAKDSDATAANLRGQVAHLQEIAKANGKGTQFPPCWADETSGKPEYIFDISITSNGVVIRDNAIPHRAAEQARLPIQQVEFGRAVSAPDFLTETQALLDWSNHQDPVCRFFVRLFDLTGNAEKATFKTGLRTVESHFYKLLIDSTAGAPQ